MAARIVSVAMSVALMSVQSFAPLTCNGPACGLCRRGTWLCMALWRDAGTGGLSAAKVRIFALASLIRNVWRGLTRTGFHAKLQRTLPCAPPLPAFWGRPPVWPRIAAMAWLPGLGVVVVVWAYTPAGTCLGAVWAGSGSAGRIGAKRRRACRCGPGHVLLARLNENECYFCRSVPPPRAWYRLMVLEMML